MSLSAALRRAQGCTYNDVQVHNLQPPRVASIRLAVSRELRTRRSNLELGSQAMPRHELAAHGEV